MGDAAPPTGIRRRDVLRGSVALAGAAGLAGCISVTDDGVSIAFGSGDEPRPTPTPHEDPATPSEPDTPTDSPTATEYPTPSGPQDCIGLDPEAVEIEEDGRGGYQLVDGESVLLSFEEFDNAKASRDIIKGYGFTRQCFVGRPNAPFAYWLVDRAPPNDADASPVDTPDCIGFDPDTIEVEDDGAGGYQIVDDDHVLLSFDELANATRTRDLIQHYGFTRQCFVGRPNPPFAYWLVTD